MSETKERSGIFKFFYVFLSIITFPIFAVLFIFRHPLWILFILLLLAGGAAYWPMIHHNVKLTEVVSWYQNKYQETKFDLAKKAMSEGNSSYVPKVVLDEMKKIEEEAEEAKLPKGENYNAKVVRDKKSEDMKATLKKRGGFKKKNDEAAIEENTAPEVEISQGENPKAEAKEKNDELETLMPSSGGLSAILPARIEKNNVAVTPDDAEADMDLSIGEEDETSAINEQPKLDEDINLDLGLDDEQLQPEIKSSPKQEIPASLPQADTSIEEDDEMDLF